MKKTLLSLAVTATLGLASMAANAALINVGGVVWDPDATGTFPSAIDFTAKGSVYENAVSPPTVTHVTGWGQVEKFNSQINNQAAFCPGCELTYKFDMDLVSITPISGSFASFSFNNLVVSIYRDYSNDFVNTAASASNGDLWLELTLRAADFLTGTGTDIGTGSDKGSGGANLDATGGIAMANFDTNTRLNGTDVVFSSEFQPDAANPGFLTGNFTLTGNTVPEPGSLALLGLGLVGLAAARRRKVAA